MKVLIIEDEMAAARRLRSMLMQYDPQIEIAAVIDSVVEAVNYFSASPQLDLVLMDVQLADGLCFEILGEMDIPFPVIFTTAYDQYALEAFKVNSVDYLLKPIHPRDLANSLDKFEKIRQQYHQAAPGPYTRLLERMQARQPAYKERFLVKSGRAYCSILSSEIAYLYSEQKVTFLHTRQHKRYLLDGSLEEIYKKLDPRHFFKVNRAFVVSHACIKQIEPFFNHRMKLSLSPDPGREVLVSRGNVPAFKAWLDG